MKFIPHAYRKDNWAQNIRTNFWDALRILVSILNGFSCNPLEKKSLKFKLHWQGHNTILIKSLVFSYFSFNGLWFFEEDMLSFITQLSLCSFAHIVVETRISFQYTCFLHILFLVFVHLPNHLSIYITFTCISRWIIGSFIIHYIIILWFAGHLLEFNIYM